MSAQPVPDYDPDDPVEILRVLPQFRAEYQAAAAARRPEGYHALREMLRLWRLTTAAYTAPGFERSLAAVREAVRAGQPGRFGADEAGGPDWGV